MKKYYILIFVTLLLLNGFSQKPDALSINKVDMPSIDNIQGINLNINAVLATGNPIPLNPDDLKDKAIIIKVLGWLNAAEFIAEDKNQVVIKSGGPTVLEMELENGNYVYIEPALDFITSKLANGDTVIESHPVDNQIILKNQEKAIRLESPELYAWISGGWQEDFNLKSNI